MSKLDPRIEAIRVKYGLYMADKREYAFLYAKAY
jgi:hypothetical protein